MKNFTLIILSILFFSCTNKNRVPYSLPSDKDINEIISEILITDSVHVFKSHIMPDSIVDRAENGKFTYLMKFPFCIDLEKFRVCFPKPSNDSLELTIPMPSGFFGLNYTTILERGNLNNRLNFSKADSAYFVFQSDTLNHFTISGDILKDIYTTTLDKQKGKEDTYFSCTIPIFSADKTKAYVELNYRCWGLCSYGRYYILSKEKNRWTIVKKDTHWFS